MKKRFIFRWFLAIFGLASSSAPAITAPVMLSWSADPQTTVAVSWERETPGRGTVQYGTTTNYDGVVLDAGGYRRHVIHLRDLEPGTLYHYKAGSSDGFETADFTFRTAARREQSVHFAVHGDLQGGIEPVGSRSVADAIIRAQPDLVIHIGDLAAEDGIPGFASWETFFNAVTGELERSVFMPAPGNHDNAADPNAYYWRLMELPERPGAESYYSFESGPVHFTALNSEVNVEGQTNWLARDLQAAAYDTNIVWIIPYFHRPPYSWGERGGEDHTKTNFSPVFVKYEADMVFNGHSHNYQRIAPIRGVRYVVAGGGGGRLYWFTNLAGTIEYATSCYHFVSVQITNSAMNYRAIRSDDLVFDSTTFTHPGRFVRVEPAFPRRGETAKIHYRASRGPLYYCNPVFIHLGADAFDSAFADAPMTYNADSGLWEYSFVVPSAITSRLAFVFHDAAGTNWHNNYTNNWQALLDRASFSPSAPTAGAPVRIRYEADMGPLKGSGQIYARAGFDDWTYALDGDAPLTNTAGAVWEGAFVVPSYARQVEVAFHNGTAWDDDYGRNWRAATVNATSAPPWLPLPLVVAGTPIIGTNPPVIQNNPGDNLDFNRTGTPLAARDASSGFGEFGKIYFNHDSSNLYIGADLVMLGGTNNVFVLFLGLDTQTDHAWNLWHKSGPPNALDYLHNLSFTEPMDMAIVCGDEYGDDADYTNFSYGGYNFGQGIYSIGTNSGAFAPVPGARLSQFDGTGIAACVTADDDGDRYTERWAASLPWGALSAAGGVTSLNHLLVAGVIGSSSVNGPDRYLSAEYVGVRAYGNKDAYGQFAFNFVTLVPSQVYLEHGDYRGDGIPNGWRHFYFGSIQGPEAGADSDSDRMNNWQEWYAGTHPTNPLSFLGMNGVVPASMGGEMLIQWQSVTGKEYSVERAASLSTNGSFAPIASNLPGQADATTFTNTLFGTESAGFYRVRVE